MVAMVGMVAMFPTLRETCRNPISYGCHCGLSDSSHGGAETSPPLPPSPPENAFDLQEERLAIQREADLAVPQRIPNAVMIAGLIRAARWPR
jgi:hypothetical protein